MSAVRGRKPFVKTRLGKTMVPAWVMALALVLITGGRAAAIEAVEVSAPKGWPVPPVLVPPQLDFQVVTAPGYNPMQPCLDAMGAMSGSGPAGAAGNATAAEGGIDHASHHRKPGETDAETIWTEQDRVFVIDQLTRALAALEELIQESSVAGLGEAGGETTQEGRRAHAELEAF